MNKQEYKQGVTKAILTGMPKIEESVAESTAAAVVDAFFADLDGTEARTEFIKFMQTQHPTYKKDPRTEELEDLWYCACSIFEMMCCSIH